MRPIIDPRKGDVEDDASSTKRRSMFSLAGSLLAEISLPKLIASWVLLIGLPGLLVGVAPLLATIWFASLSSQASYLLTGLWPALLLFVLIALGWLGGRRLLRLAENSFWSLNALAVQPGYVLCREGLRHVIERLLPSGISDERRAATRAATAAVSGLVVFGIGLWIAALAWPSSRWVGSLSDLASPSQLIWPALVNSVVIVAGYLAFAALVWGVADATMAQPRDLTTFHAPSFTDRAWRVAHLSDIHVVGERYGFRIESGRSGPQGNERLRQIFAHLDRIHAENPLDAILITGDVTDAGRSSEWSEFFDALAPYQHLSGRMLLLPGNHDLNVVDKANPARLDLPTSPNKRLRQLRAISASAAVQGSRVRVVDNSKGRIGATLSETLKPYLDDIAAFAEKGPLRLSMSLAELWAIVFPMVQPPETDDGLGIILLNSNAETHFSFTNALGMMPAEQAHALDIITSQYPQACWIVALHHHLVEYPKRANALSERIGTALINGSWFVRHIKRLAGRAAVMHGHRHIDWIGECGGLMIVSAPSPVMEATDQIETYFYVHTLVLAGDGRLHLLEPERIRVAAQLSSDSKS